MHARRVGARSGSRYSQSKFWVCTPYYVGTSHPSPGIWERPDSHAFAVRRAQALRGGLQDGLPHRGSAAPRTHSRSLYTTVLSARIRDAAES